MTAAQAPSGEPDVQTEASTPTADPTLLQLARGGSRWAYVGIAVLLLSALVALLSATLLRPGKPKGGAASVSVDGTPGFKMDYARGELKVVSSGAKGVELVDRRESDPAGGSRLLVTPLQLPAYEGSPTGVLPLASAGAERTIAARFDPGSTRFTEEGLVNVGPNPGYQLTYVAKRDGSTWYGRAAIVVPDVDGQREALLMDGQEQRVSGYSRAIKSPRAVGRQGDLRRPMRTLVFVD
ncbi:MAG: hypothetical protein JHD16_10735 [Solirubrobacteraceae bacterium]|nr:hypothetical protein [Solirubrobacteraceae bacterium]